MRFSVVVLVVALAAVSCGLSSPPDEMAARCGESSSQWGIWSVGNQTAQASISLGEGVDFAEGAAYALASMDDVDPEEPILCVDVTLEEVVPCGQYGSQFGGYAGTPALQISSDIAVGAEAVQTRYRLFTDGASEPGIDYAVDSLARCPRRVVDDGENFVAQYEVGVSQDVLSRVLRLERIASKGGASESQCEAIEAAMAAKEQRISQAQSAESSDDGAAFTTTLEEASDAAEGGSTNLQIELDKMDSIGDVASIESIFPRLCT